VGLDFASVSYAIVEDIGITNCGTALKIDGAPGRGLAIRGEVIFACPFLFFLVCFPVFLLHEWIITDMMECTGCHENDLTSHG
jgi:hypothetical protein